MENLPIILFSIVIAVLVFCLTYLAGKLARLKPSLPTPPKPDPPRDPGAGETFEVGIAIGENNRWQISNPKGAGLPLYLRKGDTVVWSISGTDAVFQFPRSDHFYFDKERAKGCTEIDPWVFAIGPDGGQITMLVAENACPGAFTYSVYCNTSKKSNIPVTGYAQGGSPPEFVILI